MNTNNDELFRVKILEFSTNRLARKDYATGDYQISTFYTYISKLDEKDHSREHYRMLEPNTSHRLPYCYKVCQAETLTYTFPLDKND